MMANRKKSYESSRFGSKNTRRHAVDAMFLSSSSSEEEVTTGCRSCKYSSKENFDRSRVEKNQQTGQDPTRREDDSFSFKHFLESSVPMNYQNTGARPKVYSTTSNPNNMEKDSTVYSRNPTELPDFVQDHLVIEQCYLNRDSNQQAIPDIDNLPDFALNSVEQRQTRLRNESKKVETSCLGNLPFDLTGSLDKGLPHRDHPSPNAMGSSHLNLSTFDRSTVETIEHPESSGFPLDLPIPPTESDPSANIVTRDCAVASEASVPKSLPDFLNDGPIHNRTALSTDPGCSSNTAESVERRLLLENERLRQELELARTQVNNKSKRINLLESELESRKEVDHEETAHLEVAMDEVEGNLKRSWNRAVSAESTVSTLRKEIKTLMTEISLLRLENRELRAVILEGGNERSSLNVDRRIRRLATDLRTAASTAEVSLRQLMSGVENLRVLASTLENVDRIEDRTKDFVPNFDEDNAAGSAL